MLEVVVDDAVDLSEYEIVATGRWPRGTGELTSGWEQLLDPTRCRMRRPWSTALLMLVVGALLSVGLGPVAMAEPDDEDEYSTVDVLTCSTDGGGSEVQLNGVDGGSDGERYEWTLSRDGTVIMRDAFTYIDNDETGTRARPISTA